MRLSILSRTLVYLILVLSCYRYVLAQQKPSLYIPKYSDAPGFRSNLCERQRKVFNGELTLQYALEGLSLSVITTNYPDKYESYYFSLSEDGTIREQHPGLFVEVMDALAERARFQWRNSFGVVGPENPDNKTWTDHLLWSVDKFDLSLDYWLHTTERMRLGMSFMEGYVDGSLILVGKLRPDGPNTVNIWSFLEPFDPIVWLLVIAAILFTGLLYYILEEIRCNRNTLSLNAEDLKTVVFLSSMGFTGNYGYSPNTTSTRILSFSWSFWALIMGAAYTANLASYLVIINQQSFYVQNVDQAVRLGLPICVHEGTVPDTYMSSKYPAAVLKRKFLETDVFNAVMTEECRVAVASMVSWETHQVIAEVNTDCRLAQIGEVIAFLSGGIGTIVDAGVNCTSLLHYVLDMHMKSLKAEGVLTQIFKKHLQNLGDQTCTASNEVSDDSDLANVADLTSSDDDHIRYSMNDLGGIFIFHLVLSVIAVITELGGGYYKRYRRKKLEQETLESFPDDELEDQLPRELSQMSEQEKQDAVRKFSSALAGGSLNTMSEQERRDVLRKMSSSLVTMSAQERRDTLRKVSTSLARMSEQERREALHRLSSSMPGEPPVNVTITHRRPSRGLMAPPFT